MYALNLPQYPFKLVERDGKTFIFDPVRRQYLMLTPEEWVRQHFVQFLVKEKGFPAGLFSMERKVRHNQRQGRYDVLCRDHSARALLLVECKAPTVKITSETFEQAVRYNQRIEAPYIALTNGLEHYIMKVEFQERQVNLIKDFPEYQYIAPNT